MEKEKEELKQLIKQKTRDVLKAGDNASLIEQTYDELISDAQDRIDGLQNQLLLAADNANTSPSQKPRAL